MKKTMHMLSRNEGYGLVVIAALFTAFAVIAAATMDRNSVAGELARQQQASTQLSKLSLALAKYAKYNGDRLPCPASYLVLMNDSSFGEASSPPCHGGGAAPSGTYLVTGSNSKMLGGMVPVKELVPYGISYDDAFDPWGSRIIYLVHRDLTTGASDVQVDAALDTDRPVITDYVTGQEIDPPPDMVLVSFGRDRIKGRLRTQTVLTDPVVDCGTTDRRYLNCDDDNSFIKGPLFTSSQAATTAYFDDTVSAYRYHEVVTGPPCGGTYFDGNCWYMTADVGPAESCDALCTAHGTVYNIATRDYAGSDSLDFGVKCVNVINAIRGTAFSPLSLSNAPVAWGCAFRPSINGMIRGTIATTSSVVPTAPWRRVCACDE